MAITHATATRDAFGTTLNAQVNAGTTDPGGDLRILDAAVEAVIITFQDPAFGAPATGVITLLGVPLSNTASASVPAADNFEMRSRDNTVVLTGTVTGTGGGGDLELNNTNIASGQTVQITALTWTAPP